ncbi:MAG: FkbM family methyltransferase [Candidatus Micrarchaeota archaeon]
MNKILLFGATRAANLCRYILPIQEYLILRDQALDTFFPEARSYDLIHGYEQRYSSAFHDYLEKYPPAEKKHLLSDFKRGLDSESGQVIDRLLSFYSRINGGERIPHRERYDLSWKDDIAPILKELVRLKGELNPPPEFWIEEHIDCFYFQSGLRFVPPEIRSRCTRGKDILDCGAFNGDTAFMFSNMTESRKVYAFEPDNTNHSKMLGLLEAYPQDKVVPLRLGVGEKAASVNMHSEGPSSYVDEISGSGNIIQITDIDSFVDKEGISPGVIKMDIEGHEMKAIRGALKTIKKHRPVLLIAMYHSPVDFFEIKPLLEKAVPGYRFMVRHLVFSHAAFETFLIAYPVN